MKSNLYAEEAHKGDAHQSRQDKGDADAAQRTGNVGIGGETFADSGEGSDCEKPAETPAATCTDCRPDTREIALLHEERTAEDGTVDGDEREEDTERRMYFSTVISTSCVIEAMTAINMMSDRKLRSTSAYSGPSHVSAPALRT